MPDSCNISLYRNTDGEQSGVSFSVFVSVSPEH